MNVSSTINPFGQAREALGLTKVALAGNVPCSKSCVLFNEQGLYVSPIKVIMEFFVDHGYDEAVLRRGYYAFQRSQRQEHQRVWLLPPVDVTSDPLRNAIRHNGFSITRFCKDYCLQPVLLHDPKSVGPYVEKVFLAAGFTPVQMEELKERFQEHYDYVNGPVRHRSEDSELPGTNVLGNGGVSDSRSYRDEAWDKLINGAAESGEGAVQERTA